MKSIYSLLSFVFSVVFLNAAVTLPSFFTSNMVLQQQTQAPIWGKAIPGRKVTVTTSWDQKTYTTTADATGSWKVDLSTPVAGFTPYTLTVSDGRKIVLTNILIGEVWLASGQSNMEMPLAGWGKVVNYEQEISQADFPYLRLLQAEKHTSELPLPDLAVLNGGWVVCNPSTIPEFSSTAYFFGRELFRHLNVPIGLIHSSWGGTIAEAWTSGKSLRMMPAFAPEVEKMEKAGAIVKPDFEKMIAEWRVGIDSADKGYVAGKPVWSSATIEDESWQSMKLPGNWESQGLEALDGIVWFRRSVQLPEDWAGKQLSLHLDVIDDDDVTFFNGVEVGRTVGWNIERSYTIPAKLVKPGENIISVRVFDGSGGGGLYGLADKLVLKNSSGEAVALAGEWSYKVAVDFKNQPTMPQNPNSPNRVTVLSNAMIHPLVPFAIQGAIWYQGESNADRADQYGELFPLMIQDWRSRWNRNFPFYFVQLANYMTRSEQPSDPAWAYLRDSQRSTLRLANTGMAVTIDIGDAIDIHPKNKQDVGRRLALQALAKTYNKPVDCDGPVYHSFLICNSAIRLKFAAADNSLRSADGKALIGFTIAGPDRVFYNATAVVEGSEIIVSSPDVQFPMAVRYAWANNPVCNLTDKSGLPASPFRTDNW